MAGSAVVEVTEKIVNVDKKGNAKIVDTLTKSGALKKVNGKSVIKLESGNDLVVKNKGRQYHDSEVVNIPKQTITQNKSNKSNRNKTIDGIEKNDDDLIEINNVDLQPEKIIHHKPNKKSRNKKTPDDDLIINDTIDFNDENIEPSKIKLRKPKNIDKLLNEVKK